MNYTKQQRIGHFIIGDTFCERDVFNILYAFDVVPSDWSAMTSLSLRSYGYVTRVFSNTYRYIRSFTSQNNVYVIVETTKRH